jgi:hypothetical protein
MRSAYAATDAIPTQSGSGACGGLALAGVERLEPSQVRAGADCRELLSGRLDVFGSLLGFSLRSQ